MFMNVKRFIKSHDQNNKLNIFCKLHSDFEINLIMILFNKN